MVNDHLICAAGSSSQLMGLHSSDPDTGVSTAFLLLISDEVETQYVEECLCPLWLQTAHDCGLGLVPDC